MSMPVGTWSIFTFGPPGAQSGALTIFSSGSTPAGTLTFGAVSQSLSVLWDESAQQLSFTTVVPAGGAAAAFDVYTGNAFQPFPATLPHVVFAGTFRHYSPTGPATPLPEFGWYAIAAAKPKEKEKDKEKEHKDKEKDKEKDGFKEIEKHPLDKLPEFQFGSGTDETAAMRSLEQRLAALEQRVATGQSFIKPEERPAVGETAVKPEKK